MQGLEASSNAIDPYSHQYQDGSDSLDDSDADTVVEVSRKDVYPNEQIKDDSVELSSQKEFEATALTAAMRSLSVATDNDAIGRVLRSACRRGDRNTVLKILSSGFKDVDNESPGQWTALHCAAVEGHSDIADDLIEAGARLFAWYEARVSGRFKTLVNNAIEMANRECLSILIRHSEVPATTRAAIGVCAVAKYDLECLQWIIQKSFHGDLNAAFQHAVSIRNAEAVHRLLMQDMIDPMCKSFVLVQLPILCGLKYGDTIIEGSDLWDVRQLLIKHGCLEAVLGRFGAGTGDELGDLVSSGCLHHHDCVPILQEKLSQDASFKKEAFFQLLWSLYRKDLKSAKVLLECGVEVNQRYGQNESDIPLLVAIGNGHRKVDFEQIKLLLSYGADPIFDVHRNGNSPIRKAEKLGHKELVKLFWDHFFEANNLNRPLW